jgi:hypothetical protein
MKNGSDSKSVADCLLESAARCLDSQSVRALGDLKLEAEAKQRLESIAEKANEGQLTSDEAAEYGRFIELEDVIASLRLKAGRYLTNVAAQ